MHNYGYAVDVNTQNTSEMSEMKLPGEDKTLMEKWGFRRYALKNGNGPAGTYNPDFPASSVQETWHIEPVGLTSNLRANIRGGAQETPSIVDAGSVRGEIGDPIEASNVLENQNMDVSGAEPTSVKIINKIEISDNSLSQLASMISNNSSGNNKTGAAKAASSASRTNSVNMFG
jgi:hypothetical protein